MDNITELIIITIMVIMSAYFSATETAFTSFNKAKMKNKANEGNKRANLVLKLESNYDKLLSTILIGNNIVNIASASLATTMFVRYFGDAGVSLSTLVMTVVVLIFGEITPKNIAKDSPEAFAMFSAPVLRVFMLVFTPLNYLFSLWKKLVNKIFKTKSDNSITEEEILTIVKDAQSDGSIDDEAGDLIQSAIEFEDLDVSEVCTPRVDIVAIKEGMSNDDIIKLFNEHGYSRLPIYKETIDDIYGIVNLKDFYRYVVEGKQELESAISQVHYVNPTMKISKLLRLFQKNHSHLALVVDEFGGISGIITLEDVIEELIGEIFDEHDKIINEIKQISDNEYRVMGVANLDKLFEELGINEEIEDITSVSGWVMDVLGKIPEVNDSFTYKNLDVKVLSIKQHRVEMVSIVIHEEIKEEE
ncbi:MAG: hemolysin family protein [Bacilli bacterium]|nr:hemolysin family protein [Bacilli bacterium]